MTIYLLLVGLSVSLVPGAFSNCCLPFQVQTYMDVMTSLSGSPQEKRFKQMVRCFHMMPNPINSPGLITQSEDEYNIIVDFPAGKVYNWNRDSCTVSRSGAFYNICIPEHALAYRINMETQTLCTAEAKLVQRAFMGVPPDIINLDTYMTTQNEYTLFYRVGLNCTFVEIGGFSSKIPQPDVQLLFLFYNTTMGIKDPSIFIPPKMCFKNVTKIERKPCFQPSHIFNFLGGPNPCFL